jgi:hypothetical protein
VTAPATPPQTPAELQAMIEDHADAVRLLEEAAVYLAVGGVIAAIRLMTVKIISQWVILFGSSDAAPHPMKLGSLLSWLHTSIRDLELKPGKSIRQHAPAARVLGAKQAREEMGEPHPQHRYAGPLSDETKHAAAEADRAAARNLDAARRLLPEKPEDVTKRGDLNPAIAAARGAAARSQASVTWAVHRELNDAAADEIETAGGTQLWVAERDACVHCLAYAGETAEPGESFPLDLTFGDKPLTPWPNPKILSGPPLHPACRCRITGWLGQDGPDGLIGFPQTLQREAKRSVLKGWALPTEGHAVRARAADRLLTQGAGLPKSVEQEAKRKLRDGTFTTGPVPDGKATEE